MMHRPAMLCLKTVGTKNHFVSKSWEIGLRDGKLLALTTWKLYDRSEKVVRQPSVAFNPGRQPSVAFNNRQPSVVFNNSVYASLKLGIEYLDSNPVRKRSRRV